MVRTRGIMGAVCQVSVGVCCARGSIRLGWFLNFVQLWTWEGRGNGGMEEIA